MPRAYWPERIAGACAVLCLAISVLLLGRPSFSNASLAVHGITDPVIAIEDAQSVQDVDYVLGEAPSPDREVMRLKERIGFALTAAYTGLFFSLSLLLLRSGGAGRIAAPAAMICAAGAAVFEVLADLAILRILDVHLFETTGAMINSIRSAAFVSWMLSALTLLMLAIYFFRSTGWLMRSVGVLFVTTAFLQLIGLRDGEFLVLAGVPGALALLGIAVAMLIVRRHEITRS